MRTLSFFTRKDQAEALIDRRRSILPWPSDAALSELSRAQDALALMLEGLTLHYPAAIAQGRTKEWADAGHAIIDLMATQHRVPTTH